MTRHNSKLLPPSQYLTTNSTELEFSHGAMLQLHVASLCMTHDPLLSDLGLYCFYLSGATGLSLVQGNFIFNTFVISCVRWVHVGKQDQKSTDAIIIKNFEG